MQLDDYRPNEWYKCKRPCNNITHSTLPRTSKRMTERITCSKCGKVIEFSTVDMPKKISNPVSRRKWGQATELTMPLLRELVKAKYIR